MDAALKRRLQARFGDRLIAPIHQRHDETEIRIGPGDVPDVLRALHDEPVFAFVVLADLAGVDIGSLFVSMFAFVGVLLLGLAYAWRKGVLTWR